MAWVEQRRGRTKRRGRPATRLMPVRGTRPPRVSRLLSVSFSGVCRGREGQRPCPVDVAVLGAGRVVADTKGEPQSVEESGWGRLRQLAEVVAEDGGVEQRQGGTSQGEGGEGVGLGVDDVSEEVGDGLDAERGRMLFVMEQDEGAYPGREDFGRRTRVTTGASGLPELVEQTRRLSRDGGRGHGRSSWR